MEWRAGLQRAGLRLLSPLLGALASAFAIVFGLFVAAMAVLCVVIVVWAVRRDRERRREWQEQRRHR